MSYYKNSNSKKFIAITICFVLIAIILCGMMTSWFQDWNPYCWFGHSYNEEGICTKCGAEQPAEVVEPEEPDEGDEPLENGGMVAAAVPSKSNMRLGVRRAAQTPAGENTYELTATIEPEDPTEFGMSWNVRWSTPASAWSSGKNVSDYVTVTQGEGLKATVTCLQAFGEKVTVEAHATGGGVSLSASCSCDYVKRVENVHLKVSNGDYKKDVYTNLGFDTAVDSAPYLLGLYPNIGSTGSTGISTTIVWGVGTIEEDVDVTVSYCLSDVFYTKLASYGYTIAQEDRFVQENATYFANSTADVKAMFGEDYFTDSAYNNAVYKALKGANLYDTVDIQFKVVATGEHSNFTRTYNVFIDQTEMAIKLTKITLSDSFLTF